MLEERHNMLVLMADHAGEAGQHQVAAANRERAAAMDKQIAQLKLLLSKLTEDLPLASLG
jgi:hypothetical protein